MNGEEITPHDIPALYYVYIVLNTCHIAVSSALLVWRRNTFPVKGHNIYLTIFYGVAVAGVSISGAGSGLARAHTCTSGTAVIYLCAIAVANMTAAQGVRLWFEYNFAEEQLKNLRSESAPDDPRGWFYRKHKYFKTSRLIGVAVSVSIVEMVIGLAVVFSSSPGYGEELPCGILLGVMAIVCVFSVVACGVLVSAYRRLGDKRDGYGIKSGFYMLCIVALVCVPVLGAIDLVEGFTNLAAYVQAIQQSFRFVTINLVLIFIPDRPLYLSFRNSNHGGLSAVSQDRSNEDGGDGDAGHEVAEVVDTAKDIELQIPEVPSISEGEDNAISGEKQSPAPEVFSSKTLTLSLSDILLLPLYSAQLASFAKHLVGEFNVEPLRFFYKVGNLQKHVKARDAKPTNIETAATSAGSSANGDDLGISVQGNCPRPRDSEKVDDSDIDLAWRAMMLYLEFLESDSPSQINISDSLSAPIHEELSSAIVDFGQLLAHTPCDDLELRRPVDVKVFDSAQKALFTLLEEDPFIRWRRAIREQVDAKL